MLLDLLMIAKKNRPRNSIRHAKIFLTGGLTYIYIMLSANFGSKGLSFNGGNGDDKRGGIGENFFDRKDKALRMRFRVRLFD